MSDNRVLLKDFIDPTVIVDVSWAPTTLGWKILYTILVVWLFWKLVHRYRCFKANQYRRDALEKLNQLTRDRRNGIIDVDQELYQSNRILKAVACHAYPNSDVAMLFGAKWCDFLTNVSELSQRVGHAAPFKNNQGGVLLAWQQSLYTSTSTHDWTEAHLKQIRQFVKAWIKYHPGEVQ